MADQSIRSLFDAAEGKRLQVESSSDSNSVLFRENLASAIATYEECRVLADRLSLFSPNETLEDIATGDLQYLLINYRIGELLVRSTDSNRKLALHTAKTAYERYLSILSDYEILSTTEKKMYEAYSENPTTFSTISTTDYTARRAAKIANFKLEKDLKRKVDFLAQNPAYLQNDDDAIRELQLTTRSLCTHNTFQAFEQINHELEILALRPPTPPAGPEALERDYRERNGIRSDEDYSERLDRRDLSARNNSGPVLSSSGKPLRPFTMLDSRQTLQKGVFRSGHNLPTMTIDEYLEEERKRGGIIEGGGAASGIIPEPDEDNYEKGDMETQKAREWDEFVEANPKGSGNTLNRG